MPKTDAKTIERKKKWEQSHPEWRAQWYAKNRDRLNEYKKAYHQKHRDQHKRSQLKRLYGLGLDEWQRLFESQRGCCAVCSRHQSELKSSLHVDHDHDSGVVRGLLCTNCNLMLGNSQDCLETLAAGIQYLKGFKKE